MRHTTSFVRFSFTVVIQLATVGGAVAACSSTDSTTSSRGSSSRSVSDDRDGTDPAATKATATGSSKYQCCINGVGYACPDHAAFEQCAGPDPGSCLDGCGSDPDCADQCFDDAKSSSSDPSGCTPDPAACKPTSSGDGTDDDSCGGTAIPCTLDMDCCEGLTCQPRDDGQPGGSCE